MVARKKAASKSVRETYALYDTANHLRSEAEIIAYLEAAFAGSETDPSIIADAIGNVARAHGIMRLSKETGLSREGLYRSFSAESNPTLGTLLKVCGALGLQLCVKKAG